MTSSQNITNRILILIRVISNMHTIQIDKLFLGNTIKMRHLPNQ